MDLIILCHYPAQQNNNYTGIYVTIIGSVIVTLLGFFIKALWEERNRKIEIKDKIYSEVHNACDNMLSNALKYNHYILHYNYYAWRYFLSLNTTKDEKYDLEMAFKNFDYSVVASDEFYMYWAKLNQNLSMIKKYLPGLSSRIMELVNQPMPPYTMDFTDVFKGNDLQANKIKLKTENDSIQGYIHEQSLGKNINTIRKLLSGIDNHNND